MSTTRRLQSLGVMLAAFCVWAVPAMAAPPANTAAPTITGTARVGETLTAQNGTWSNSPTAFQYQWQRCNASGAACANVAGATAKTYLLTSPDADRTMRVRVTSINAEGAVNARSAPTAVVAPSAAPRNTVRPTITGEPEAGGELTAEEGSWTNQLTSYAYQWQRCDIDAIACGPISGATGKTYGVRNADVGFRLRVEVTGEECQRLGLGPVEPVLDRRAVGSDHERAADREAGLGPLPRRPRVRAVPDLRRLTAESDDPRDRLAAREGVADAPLHDPDCAEPVRRLHAQLGTRSPLPRQGALHGHDRGA